VCCGGSPATRRSSLVGFVSVPRAWIWVLAAPQLQLSSGGVREAAVDWICFLFLWICFFFVGMSSSSSLLASSVLHRPPQGEIHPESPFFFALCRLFILGSTLLWLGFMLLSMMLMWLGFGMSLLFLLG
jgi:hypothetical protein